MCIIDGCDPPTFHATKLRRSRKDRTCEECRRIIAAGEVYRSDFLVYEGRGDTFMTCHHCTVAIHWLWENCGGFLHGAVWDDFEEHIREYPTLAFSLSRLAVARRRKWLRFDGQGLMAVPAVPPTLEQTGLERAA